MGLTLLTVTLTVLGAHAAGGRLWRLRRVHVHGAGLLVGVCAVQLSEPLAAHVVPHSYPLAFAVSATLTVQFVRRNLAVPGVALAGLGVVLNATVVVVNGAMPVSVGAAEQVGLSAAQLDLGAGGRNEPVGPATRLGVLGDVIPTPVPGRAEVDSPGDVALAAGLGLLVLTGMCRGRRPRARRSAAAAARTRAPAGPRAPTTSGIMDPWPPDAGSRHAPSARAPGRC